MGKRNARNKIKKSHLEEINYIDRRLKKIKACFSLPYGGTFFHHTAGKPDKSHDNYLNIFSTVAA